MVRINLVPGDRKPSARSRRKGTAAAQAPSARAAGEWLPKSPAFLVGGVGLIVIVGLVFLYFGERRALGEARMGIEEAEADSARLAEAVERVRTMEAAQERLAAQVAVMEDVVEGRLFWIGALETLSLALPEYTWLESVDREDLAPDQVRISGATFANAAVTDYMRGLEASPRFEDVTLVGVTRTAEDSLSWQNFTLVADFENYRATVVAAADTTTTEDGDD